MHTPNTRTVKASGTTHRFWLVHPPATSQRGSTTVGSKLLCSLSNLLQGHHKQPLDMMIVCTFFGEIQHCVAVSMEDGYEPDSNTIKTSRSCLNTSLSNRYAPGSTHHSTEQNYNEATQATHPPRRMDAYIPDCLCDPVLIIGERPPCGVDFRRLACWTAWGMSSACPAWLIGTPHAP